jgi:hypothetical protein
VKEEMKSDNFRHRAGMRVRRNMCTQALVHDYSPLRIYIYNDDAWLDSALNFLARVIFDPARCQSGHWYLFERWTNWRTADLFLHPADVNFYEGREPEVVEQLEYFAESPERHIFVDHRDSDQPFGSERSIHLKVSLSQSNATSRVFAIPYVEAVDDFRWYIADPEPTTFDLCFVGESTPFRSRLLAALSGRTQVSWLELTSGFFHGPILSRFADNHSKQLLNPGQKDFMRRRYIEIMRRSRFALAPRGFGLNSFRFFESLSLGIPPILVSTDCALPFAEAVDYSQFCFCVPAEVETAATAIVNILRDTSAEQRNAMAAAARSAYDNFFSANAIPLLLYRQLSRLIS